MVGQARTKVSRSLIKFNWLFISLLDDAEYEALYLLRVSFVFDSYQVGGLSDHVAGAFSFGESLMHCQLSLDSRDSLGDCSMGLATLGRK